jgi:hypothetical protein
MNSSNSSSIDSNTNEVNEENEISLIDIVNFFSENWKKMCIAGIVGLITGALYWFFLVNFEAEKTITNNGVFNVISFKALQKQLPILATQIVNENKVPKGFEAEFMAMGNSNFWQSNLQPIYALTKQESKEFATLSKELDVETTRLTQIRLSAQGSNKSKALENIEVYESFLRGGGSYIVLKSLLNSFENENITTSIEAEKNIAGTKIELEYQQRQLKNLEELLRRFPNNSGASSQVVDPKDSGAKYLPLTTQIIAINTDINKNKESLERLSDQQLRLEIIKKFLDKTASIMDKSFNGIELALQINKVIDEIQKEIPQEDNKSQQQILSLKASIYQIQMNFERVLFTTLAPNTTKKGMLKTPLKGFAMAFFGMLVYLVFRKVLVNLKNNQSSVKAS